MEHEHHHHNHQHNVENLTKAFVWGIVINITFVIVEFIAGYIANSMGLLSDAGHNLTDVASLFLSLIALLLSKKSATNKYTYGYKKTTILVSLLNAVVLMVAVAIIIKESIEKFISPQQTQGAYIIIVASVGVVINFATALLFNKDKKEDMNVKGAYLHMLADGLVSVGVVISGIVIYYTHVYVIDAIVGLVIAVVIIYSTWDLLKGSIREALDGTPININIAQIEEIICRVQGVCSVHHLHVWALSTRENALTAHIVVSQNTTLAQTQELKEQIKHILSQKEITHTTLEFETIPCDEEYCCGLHS
jgi:cation diffusion facilitator family transporter